MALFGPDVKERIEDSIFKMEVQANLKMLAKNFNQYLESQRAFNKYPNRKKKFEKTSADTTKLFGRLIAEIEYLEKEEQRLISIMKKSITFFFEKIPKEYLNYLIANEWPLTEKVEQKLNLLVTSFTDDICDKYLCAIYKCNDQDFKETIELLINNSILIFECQKLVKENLCPTQEEKDRCKKNYELDLFCISKIKKEIYDFLKMDIVEVKIILNKIKEMLSIIYKKSTLADDTKSESVLAPSDVFIGIFKEKASGCYKTRSAGDVPGVFITAMPEGRLS